MRENVVKNKSLEFAVRVVKLYQFLCDQKKEFVLSKQLLRSGTSVGAMVREAEHAETKKDFNHKMGIAQKEINETIYWLELLHQTDYLTPSEFESMKADAVEIIKIITAILKSSKTQ
ncbi:four helix bundle protein [Algoriphagus sediminis]|uniref:Four helix bundle protein n=1 Tax=Algoriphagus sediminis TaxID=3057113 RepID=A0ABT7YB79_9BACT|nr:four helix bundle protein [Algoriphagus sediminis]MDN3203781.1 four helix bundle protein [Algoriphagus sediminis]